MEEIFQLPEDLENQLPVIFEDTLIVEVSDEVEKAFFGAIAGAAKRAIQVFNGKKGFWVTTRNGRHVFLTGADKADKTLDFIISVGKGVTPEHTALVKNALSAVPSGVLKTINKVNIEDAPSRQYGGFNIYNRNMSINTGMLEVSYRTGSAVPEYYHTGSRYYVFANNYKPTFDLIVKDAVYHEVGHAIFVNKNATRLKAVLSFFSGKTVNHATTSTPKTQNFTDSSLLEKGITSYARTYLTKLRELDNTRFKAPKNFAVDLFVGENFAEVYSFWMTRHILPKRWEHVSNTFPKTVQSFLDLIGELDL
jgi:hypothetical protein